MLIRDVIDRAIRHLESAGVGEARQDAWLLLAHLRHQDRAALMAAAFDALSSEDNRQFQRLVERRAAREPLAQILGRKEFWSLDFRISADVLCPRPDSECLIEAAIEEIDKRRSGEPWTGRILDLGTGSGCLLLTLLSELPAASGVGVDISERALSIARSNSERLGLAERAQWLCADWGRVLDSHFDLIVTNPPYISTSEARKLAPEVREFEPAMALFAGDDGLSAYRALTGDLVRLLAANGVVCLEIGIGQAPAVEAIMKDCGVVLVGRRQDLAGTDRCLIARLPD